MPETDSPKHGLSVATNHVDKTHGHTHGAIDPSLFTTQRGIWAVKWSFLGLAATGLFQVLIVLLTGSVALFADTIHNLGDAMTAIPLWIAFGVTDSATNTANFTSTGKTWAGTRDSHRYMACFGPPLVSSRGRGLLPLHHQPVFTSPISITSRLRL